MKQIYKKKPEYLDVVEVLDDSQSIKEVYVMSCVKTGNITFNDNGERVITIENEGNNVEINIGMVVFRDKKSGKLITMPKDKLLQFYDVYDENDEVSE